MPVRKAKTRRVSIVIRAFNEDQHLGRLLSAIARQTLRNPEVILVDSGSTDRTLEIAGKHKARILHIQPQEFTFGRSLNKGIAAARGDVVVLASAHVWPMHEGWLERLVSAFDDPEIAIAYGKQRGTPESQFSEDQHFRKWFPEASDPDQQHGFSNNANSAIRKKIWKETPFDEELTGLEDLAWSSWAHGAGYKVAYVAEAGVYHSHDESAAQIVNRHRREAIALRQILPKSRFTLFNFAGLLVRTTFSDYAAALYQGRLIRELINIPRFRLLQYWGTYRGYRDPAKLSRQLKQVFYYPPNLLETRRPQQSAAAYKPRRKSA
jgi:glycosyltransferase involved in cell wall biosynthesis